MSDGHFYVVLPTILCKPITTAQLSKFCENKLGNGDVPCSIIWTCFVMFLILNMLCVRDADS